VRDSLIGKFTKRAAGTAPDGRRMPGPYFTVNFDIRLAKQAKKPS
jgi:hydroxyquinol 1,2-dioxygenase